MRVRVRACVYPSLDAGERGPLQAQRAGPVGDDQHDVGGTGGPLGLLHQRLQVRTWTENSGHLCSRSNNA